MAPEQEAVQTSEKSMLTQSAKDELERQAYRVIGEHSAVKTCGWTKKMVKGEGGCYKLKFYGIMSHQCMQMTTSISCANRCTFCWRGYKAPVSKEWKWKIDDPKFIHEESLKAHHNLLVGFKGNKTAMSKPQLFEASQTVKHVALSLTGEPIMYPRLNESIDLFHKNGISTFLVTNAQYPEQIRDLKPITQLYISLDAPNKELLKTIDIPLFADYWERLNKSLEYLAQKKARTCLRLTMVKGLNMAEPEEYAKLIKKSDADFLEMKAYMFVGASRKRLNKENMPLHEEVVEFTKTLMEFLPDYEICSEHIPSRVVMVAKKKFKKDGKWYTWIDFPKFHELANSGEPFTADDYMKKTPITGISGKGTLDRRKEWDEKFKAKKERKEKELAEKQKQQEAKESQEQEKVKKEQKIDTKDNNDQEKPFINEKTDELEFWKDASEEGLL